MLTTRETALVIWAGVLLLLCCLHGPTRRTLGPFLRALTAPKILIVLLIAAAYIVAVLRAAAELGWWDRGLLGTTIIWGVPALFGVGMKAVEATEQDDFFRRSLRGLLIGAVIIEFLVNAETFPLWWELVQLPLLTAVIVLAEFSKHDPDHASVRSCLVRLQTVIGLAMIGYSVVVLISKARDMAWGDFFQSLGLGIWLPLSTLPMIYILSVIMLKEKALIRIEFMDDRQLPWRRRVGYLIGSGFRRQKLRRWQHEDYRSVAKAASLGEAVRASRLAARRVGVTRFVA